MNTPAQELMLRQKDLVVYPLRKFLHQLSTGIRYDNSEANAIDLVFRRNLLNAEHRLLCDWFLNNGFTTLSKTKFTKTFTEDGNTARLLAVVTNTNLNISGIFS